MELEKLYFKERNDETYPTRRSDKIEPGKIYRARNGERIRIYAIEGKELHGAIFHRGNWEVDTWNLSGKYLAGKDKDHDRDLILSPLLQIVPGGKYRSRDGRPVKIYEFNKDSIDFPFIGSIKDDKGNWVPRVYDGKGVAKVPYGPNNDIVAEWSEG